MARRQRKNESVSYPKVKQIIKRAEPLNKQALLALTYATASRIGELSRGYIHRYKVFKYKKTGPYSYDRAYIRTDLEITEGMKKENITQDDRGIYLVVPNFKYRKATQKRATVSKVAEPWLCNIITDYVSELPEDAYLFNFSKRTAQRRLAGVWGYTPHSLRVSRAMHLHYDMEIGLLEIRDQLGHASLNHLMSYLKSRPDKYLEKMEKAILPEVIE